MRARDHTDRMLAWWQAVGVDRIDLAVRRHRLHEFRNPYDPGNLWLWQRAVPLSDLRRLLPWARAENARRSEIYARPSRGSSWPVVFLDDVDRTTALGLTRRHPALCAHTSLAGGCQRWAPLRTTARRGGTLPLSEKSRGSPRCRSRLCLRRTSRSPRRPSQLEAPRHLGECPRCNPRRATPARSSGPTNVGIAEFPFAPGSAEIPAAGPSRWRSL